MLHNSLGLPRVSKQNSELVLIKQCQTTVYRNISPVYGTLNEKISYWGHIEGTTKPRAGYRHFHGISLFGKSTMSLFMSLFKTAKGIPLISCQFTVRKLAIDVRYKRRKNYLKIIRKSRRAFCFLIKMQFGYKRCKICLKYNLTQTEKRNEKRGSISYAARTAKYSPIPEQPSVPGVSLCSSWPRYPTIR